MTHILHTFKKLIMWCYENVIEIKIIFVLAIGLRVQSDSSHTQISILIASTVD